MTVYLDLALLLNFVINYLLLLSTARLTGGVQRPWRLAGAAAFGALYAGLSLLPGFGFLQGALWRIVFCAGMVAAAFGVGRRQLRQGGLFLGLSFALGGLAYCLGCWSLPALLLAAGGLYLACRLFLRGAMTHAGQVVPVRIALGGKEVELMALQDTGNTLKDPLSGQSVLVAQYDAARRLLPCSLSPEQLQHPAEAMQLLSASSPDLRCRLVPYRAVGGSGLLLAVRCDQVTIEGRSAGRLVAFSPARLSAAGEYQALTGGGQYA